MVSWQFWVLKFYLFIKAALLAVTQLKDLSAISEEITIISEAVYSGCSEKHDLQNSRRVIETSVVFSGSCST